MWWNTLALRGAVIGFFGVAGAVGILIGTTAGGQLRAERYSKTGRTYTATNVDLPSLKLSAVQVAVAMAVAGFAFGGRQPDIGAKVAAGQPD